MNIFKSRFPNPLLELTAGAHIAFSTLLRNHCVLMELPKFALLELLALHGGRIKHRVPILDSAQPPGCRCSKDCLIRRGQFSAELATKRSETRSSFESS